MKLFHKVLVFLLIGLLCVTSSRAQLANVSSSPYSIGERRVVHSKILNEDRVLNIYLPLAFDKAKAYPIIYLLDGSAEEDFPHIVGLTQFFNLMYKMPETIVVGIANVDRKRDFTFPTKLFQLKVKYPTTGKSEQFISFLEKELQPYINQNFKTNDTNILIGQSLGGLLASEILLKQPQLFTHYLIISPSLWWDNESMLKKADILLKKDLKAWVYISVGADEGDIMIRGAKGLNDTLAAAKNPNLQLHYYLNEKADHATILHSSIMEAFRLLYPPKY